MVGKVITQDPFLRGSEYLQFVRELALSPEMVDVSEEINLRIQICNWIGANIDTVNRRLNTCLEACHACFHPEKRQEMQIWAAPLAQKFGVDAFCNLQVKPVAILVDVGRIVPQDWLSVVVHEYAHAHLGYPGHDRRFFDVLTHLCLGLGLPPPTYQPDNLAILPNWPHCQPTKQPLAFWVGSC
ncbi:MAG: hypothetical protein SAL07_05615 [Oscillatoria sp. PMC 1051.18]|uniref:hypothetical protein n=1 Tax=Oscillatoria salina TaxID=331517 RepID=UPI0013B96093|nr:hypothetical protein [Oscillatoria salina]MBZ8181044.1 hypothetical protein [Oscillatoria salina IIICB1]MEC5029372.1 hypothetical protein [Oscillatoria sp. PMC 1051.18]NET90419.1 hypothetical protein [Kamptonema sp. SIO1D9]